MDKQQALDKIEELKEFVKEIDNKPNKVWCDVLDYHHNGVKTGWEEDDITKDYVKENFEFMYSTDKFDYYYDKDDRAPSILKVEK